MFLESDVEFDQPKDFKIIEICKYMNWSLEDYRNTPQSFIQSIVIKMQTENMYVQFKNNQAKK